MTDCDQTSTDQASKMPQDHDEAVNVKSSAEKGASTEGIKTLGVLFVHGIGAQQRGDTLAQCATAIHGWLREWINQPFIEGGNISVDLLDTDLTQPRADAPAHSRLIFRKEGVISHRSWLLAESCWAEAFHPPAYREIVRWALWGLPLTIILHLVSTFRRHQRVQHTINQALKREYLTLEARRQLETDLGSRHGSVPTDASMLRKFLVNQAIRAGHRWLISPFLLAFLLVVAIFVQAILVAVTLIGLFPIGFLRSFAGRVQKTVAAVLGDSYLFVASPISASASVTQVKKDYQWLSERCDQVVILAHSQGAAVAYRAIEEWSWEGQVPQKLNLLISYGSGLQKLFALKELSRGQTSEKVFNLRMGSVFAVVGLIGIMTFWLWVVGMSPFWLVALSFTAGFVFLMLALMWFDRAFRETDPELPVGVKWANFYSSSDPVSNGPIAVKPPQYPFTGNVVLDEVNRYLSQELVDFFHFAQREVVNQKSSIADHTSYWQAKDDFVSRVVMQLLRMSDISSPGTVDSEWLELAALRRRWRVGLRIGCRNTAILATLCIAFWPREIIEQLGRSVVGLHFWAVVSLQKQWMLEWIPRFAVPDLVYGSGALLICIFGLHLIATAGWNMWERREFGYFFRREPFRAAGVGLVIFALGWLGILAVIPAATTCVNGQTLWPSLWTSSLLLIGSCWTIVKSGKGPGRFSSWIPTLLEQGEMLLEQKAGNRTENLARAQGYFSWACKWAQRDSMYRIRALLGNARVLEQSEEKNEEVVKHLKTFYEEALASLERMGKDTEAIREHLNKLSTDTASLDPTQQHSASSL